MVKRKMNQLRCMEVSHWRLVQAFRPTGPIRKGRFWCLVRVVKTVDEFKSDHHREPD